MTILDGFNFAIGAVLGISVSFIVGTMAMLAFIFIKAIFAASRK